MGGDDWNNVASEELRFATVMNGGVSLAVWMGGVAHELNLLSWADDEQKAATHPAREYRTVLRVARSTAVVDVLAGTSAGGINGGALALAQVNRGADLADLRTLWREQGRMQNLLRDPFRGNPTSLLKGDEYFLPSLNRAIRSLVRGFDPSGRHVDLIMPTTLLASSIQATPDALGQLMRQEVYGGRFHFSLEYPVGSTPSAATLEQTAAAIALAARSSSGFPLAFEPTWIPVGSTATRGDATLRPDMADHASWAEKGVDRSRFAVDGGALANTPTRIALAAIDKRRARGPVRRVMLLVFPHALQVAHETAQRQDDTPTLIGEAVDIFGALRAQGSQTFVEEVEEHNRRTRGWRGGRTDVLRTAGTPASLYRLVSDDGWEIYRRIREREGVDSLASRVNREGWSVERIRAQVRVAQEVTARQEGSVPYLPPAAPWPPANGPDPAGSEPSPGWLWGVTVATGIADVVVDILRRALAVARAGEADILESARGDVEVLRDEIVAQRTAIDSLWTAPDEEEPTDPGAGAVWRARQEAAALVPDPAYWRARLVAYRRATRPSAASQTADEKRLALLLPTAGLVRDVVARRNGENGAAIAVAVRAIAGVLADDRVRGALLTIAGEDRGRLVELDVWGGLLDLGDVGVAGEPGDPVARLLLRLLALDTATWLVAEPAGDGTDLPIDLVQLSLAVDHEFATLSSTPDDKAAGRSLGNFGGFLKAAWRINDWTWGRLDAAQMLCRIVLSPARLRRIQAVLGWTPEQAADHVLAELTSLYATPPAVDDPLRVAAHDELLLLFDLRNAFAQSVLTDVAAYAARPRQWRIILEELPELADAVLIDRLDGQNPRSRGELFVRQQKQLLDDIRAMDPSTADWQRLGAQALTAFDRAGIGREDLAEEAGSDAIITTAATAAAVGITVVDSKELGVTALRPFTRAVRGAALLPYWFLIGLTGGSSMARALALAGFALGGVLLALGLVGALGGFSAAAAMIGAVTVLAAFGYSALRTGSLLHGVVLLGPVVPLLCYAVDRAGGDAREAAATVGIVLAIAVALVVLGSLPWPLGSPATTFLHAADGLGVWLRRRWWELPVAVVIVAGTSGLLVWSWDWLAGHVTLPWLTGAAVAVAVIGCALTWWSSRGLKLWGQAAGPGKGPTLAAVRHPAGVAAGWAAVYGFAYLAIAVVVAWQVVDSDDPWHPETGDWTGPVLPAVLGWCTVLGVVLLLAAPGAITGRARDGLERRLAVDPGVARVAAPDYGEVLLRRGLMYRYLVRRIDDQGALTWTASGRRLPARLAAVRIREWKRLGLPDPSPNR